MTKIKKIQENKGITLIALVVTIMILLILGGISINGLFGSNGLITRAKQAALEQKKQGYFEEINLEIMDEQTERMSNAKEEALIKSLKERIQKKKWTNADNVIMCKEIEGTFKEQDKEEENTVLIVDTTDNYEIIIDVDNIGITAEIRVEYFEKIEKYKVKYNINGGTGETPKEQTIRKDFNIILPENTSTKSGYKFAGWNKDKNATTGAQGGSKYKPEENETLYAIWTQTSITITYNSNEGTGEMKASTATGNEETTLPQNIFTKEGYSFVKWNTKQDGTGTDYANGAKVTLGEDTTLYAQWEKSITATININNSKKLTEGTTVTIGGTAYSSDINKIELIIGKQTVYTEEVTGTGTKTYTKTINIDNLSNIANLMFNETYDAKLKLTSTSGINKEVTTTGIKNYTVGNTISFSFFSEAIKNGTTFSGETIYQVKDISFKQVIMNPIGDNINKFSGTYSGGDHNMTDISITSSGNYVGLFGFNAGTIKNLTVVGTITKTTGTSSDVNSYVGGIAAFNTGTISNCTNNATVKGTLTNESKITLTTGGVVGGQNGTATIDNCHNKGNATSTVTNCYGSHFGGLLGFGWNTSKVTNSDNIGTITSNSTGNIWSYIGGVIGGTNGTIENCKNNGAVNGTENNGKAQKDSEYCEYMIGGIIGGTNSSVKNCINSGKVTSTATSIPTNKSILTGGIVGWNESSYLYGCINNGEIRQTTKISAANALTGGIVAIKRNGTVENCKNTAYIYVITENTNESWLGGVVGGTWYSTNIIKCSNVGNNSQIILNATLNTNYIDQASNYEHANIGGIVGCLYRGSSMDQCYNEKQISGTITCAIEKYIISGGIVGENFGSINNCYNTGSVGAYNMDTTSSMCVGGIIGFQSGEGSLKNSYNTNLNITRSSLSWYKKPKQEFKGLIIGYNAASVSNSYYIPSTNDETYYATAGIGAGITSGVTTKTASQMQGLASTLGTTYWTQSSSINSGYPYLKNNMP